MTAGRKLVWLLALLLLVASCQTQDLIQQVCSADKSYITVGNNPDILIGGLFEMRHPSSNGLGCDEPVLDLMQAYEAARFTINSLNSANFIPGITLGLQAYDTCSQPSVTLEWLQEMYPQTVGSGCTDSNKALLGLVGPMTSEDAIPAAKYASSVDATLISPKAMATQLSDTNEFPTFLRTTPSNAVMGSVVVELLQQLQWETNLLIVYTNDEYGRTGYESILQAADSQGICLIRAVVLDPNSMSKDAVRDAISSVVGSNTYAAGVVVAHSKEASTIVAAVDEVSSLASTQWIFSDLDITADMTAVTRARGVMVVYPSSPAADGFKNYFIGLEADLSTANSTQNPWFRDWYEAKYNCRIDRAADGLPQCSAQNLADLQNDFVLSPWVVPTMKAVAAYAEVARQLCDAQSCPLYLGEQDPGQIETRLKTLVPFENSFPVVDLRGVDVQFDANGDPIESDFTVYNYNNRSGNFVFEKIGEFANNVLTLTSNPVLYDALRMSALSTNPTVPCPAAGCTYCLKPQDEVQFRYTSGDIVVASLVGAHTPGGASFTCGEGLPSRLLSLIAAEWAVSRYQQSNPSKLRGVSFGSLVADVCPDAAVAGGFLTDLLSGNNRLIGDSGSIIQADNIFGFVDETDGEQALVISPILENYTIPEIQAETMMGEDLSIVHAITAVPTNDMLYEAVTSVLLRFGWNYVQVASESSGIYREMANTFKTIAGRQGICVLDMIDIDTDINGAVNSLRSMPYSQVVVVIAEMSHVRQLSTAISNAGATGTLQLVAGTEQFMTDMEYSSAADRGFDIMFGLEEPQPSETFKSWLRGLSQDEIAAHPFAREFIEIAFDCSLDASTRGSYTSACGPTATFSSVSDDYYIGKTHYVIESVNAFADKLDELLLEVCGSSYNGVCSSFRSDTETRAKLDEKLRSIDKADGFGIESGRSTTNLMFYQRQGNNDISFATFNTEDRRLTSFNTAALTSLPGTPACSGPCVECQYLFTLQTGVFTPGDWLIGGLFGVNEPGPEQYQPYMCGDIKTAYGPQFTTAMLYALAQVNAGTAPVSVKGVTFGGLALDHCSNPNRANLLVSSIYSSYLSDMGVQETQILSWLTDITMATEEAEELLNPLGVAVVSPSATSPDLMDYDNFYRTVQGDSTVATALVKIIKTLEFTYFQVVYSDSDYGQDGLMALTSAAQVEGICASLPHKIESTASAAMDTLVTQLLADDSDVVVVFTDTTDFTPLMEAVGRSQAARTSLFFLLAEPFENTVQTYGPLLSHRVMSLQIQTGVLSQYNSFLDSSPLSNPYFAEYYSKLYQCDLPGYSTYGTACSEPLAGITANSGYVEDNYVLSTINAVYASVDALDRTVREYCDDGYTEPCAEFLSAPDRRERFNLNLGDVNFVDEAGNSFRFLDREGNVIYDILQSNAQGLYDKVGSYAGVTLEIEDVDDSGYADVNSGCSSSCSNCITQTLDFSYTPGDIYLGGVFDVHYGSTNPFECSTTVKTLNGFLLLEAFHYALNQVNGKKDQFADILPGVRLGGIGVDACESEIRGAYLVSNINNGYMNLTREGNIIAPSTIDAYVGSYGSRASIYLAQVLTDLEIPQISYSAGNPTLSDERYYPYFYRTVPSDTNLVEAILKFLDAEDIRYVQVVYEDTEEGAETKDYFVSMAASYRVCVAQTVDYPDINTISAETANDVVSRLIERPSANTVVTFLNTGLISAMLEGIERSADARNKLRFIGSDDWADNQDAIETAGGQALNSVTLKLDSDDVEGFEQYINERTVANAEENPWFGAYYEAIHECYISKVDTKGYSEACSSTLSDTINQPNYQQDQGVVYVMDAVYAAAFALHETLKEKCGESYSAVCQAYRNSGDRRERVNENLQNVTFNDPDGMSFNFVNRSGNYGYRYYSIISGVVSDAQYTEIGTYNATSGQLMLDTAYENQVDSGCQREDACTECPLIRDNSVRYVTYSGPTTLPDDATTIIGFFDIHEQGVDPYRCGDINPEGFQQFLAFFYTVEKVLGSTISGSSSSLNGIRVVAIDTCSNSLRVDQDLYGLLAGDGLCNSMFDDQIVLNLGNLGSVVTLGQLNTEAASRVLESPGVTYISPDALSPALDDEMHLVRSIAPISATMSAVASLLQENGWTFVDTVYQETAESYHAVESLDEYTTNAGICLGSRLAISDEDTSQDIVTILTNLNGDTGSKVVVLLGSQSFVKAVLSAASSLGVANNYLWVIAGTWEPTEAAIQDLGVGSSVRLVTVYRRMWEVPTFRTHVNGLSYDSIHGSSNTNIPVAWYDEFYQLVFECNLPNSERPRSEDLPTCDTTNRFNQLDWTTDPFILNTIAAAYAAGSGLRTTLETCGLSNCNTGQVLGSSSATRDFIKDNILNVQWDMRSSNDGQIADTNLDFDMVNRWWDQGHDYKYWSNGNEEGMANSPGDLVLPAGYSPSSCTETEEEGFCGCDIVIPAGTSISQPMSIDNRYTPSEHRNYYRYQSDGDKTFDWPVWAIPVGILTSLGIAMTVILFLILICTYPVRGGTSVLGYMAIVGIVCVYAINFAFFLHATDAVCGIRRFLLGVAYMITLAPLLVKAIDNWRYSHVDYAKDRYSGISSACSMLMMAFALVLIQCVIPIMWLILRHPTASKYYPETGSSERHDNWWCDPPDDYDLGLVLSFSFVVFILVVTAGFSALAYDSKRNSYESRWILFSCVATGGCFLVWMVVTTNAGPPYRDPAVAIANFVNATVLMIVMPLRKSVLMCRAIDEKNDEKLAMEINGNGRRDYGYNREYDNPTYELNDYENTFMDSKSEEF